MAKNKNVNTKKPNKKVEVEQDEVFYSTKKRGILYFIWTWVFWIVIAFLLFVWVFDFIRVKSNKEAAFCIQEKTHTFEDGTVHECLGLGYKVFKYNRSSLNVKSQFGPFFAKMKDNK